MIAVRQQVDGLPGIDRICRGCSPLFDPEAREPENLTRDAWRSSRTPTPTPTPIVEHVGQGLCAVIRDRAWRLEAPLGTLDIYGPARTAHAAVFIGMAVHSGAGDRQEAALLSVGQLWR